MTEHIVDKALADNPAPNFQAPVEEQPQLLRQARERAGMHLAAVAVALKVPVARLEALEAGRYHELPDPTFVRALAKSVCKVLKVDPTPILASLPSGHVPDLGLASGAVSTPMPSRRRSTLLGGSEAVIPVPASVLVAMVLLTLAIAFWFWLPERNVDASTSEALPVALAPLEQTLPQTLPQTPAVEVPPLAQPQTVPPATDSSPIPIVDGILQLKAADSA
jgi:cytoskeleton protein RodZ